MTTLQYLKKYAYYYLYAIAITLVLNFWFSDQVSQVSGKLEASDRPVMVIDAGHGGIDGGTTSCTGVLESSLNLEISQRLDCLFRLLGYETRMTRNTSDSLATQGDTIRAQKVSDLKNRVSIVNELDNALLLSIHQNYYPLSQYSGPQVFYTESAKELAGAVQKDLNTLTEKKDRSCKRSEGVYLMEHITVPGILIECGFLSNPGEEARLRQPEYQKKLCGVIACSVAAYVESARIG